MALLYFFNFFALCMNVEYGPLKVVIENLFRAHYKRPRRMHFEVINLPLMYIRLEFNDIEFTFLLNCHSNIDIVI